jgi:HEAT repeat protein
MRARLRLSWLSAGLAAMLLVGPGAQAGKGDKPNPKKKVPKPSVDVVAKRDALLGTDKTAAVDAAAALGDSDEAAAHEVLLDALALGLSPDVAIAALDAVGMHPGAGDASVLGFYTRYRDEEVRAAAARALGPDTAKVLIAALSDGDAKVRAAAAEAAAARKVKAATKPLLALLAKNDEAAARALAQLADVELAKVVAEQLGQVPDDLLAICLGAMLLRADFGPDPARLEVVRAIDKIAGVEATKALGDYVSNTPEKPVRPSRVEAEKLFDERAGGR